MSDLGSDVSHVLGLSDVVAGSLACCTNSACCSVLSKIQHIAANVSDWIFEMSESGKIRRMRRPISEILETRVLSRWNPEKMPKQTSFAS